MKDWFKKLLIKKLNSEINQPKDDMYTIVYKHLYNMNENIVKNVFPSITPELRAIMSHDAYAEMIQMAQAGYLKNYYERLKKEAV